MKTHIIYCKSKQYRIAYNKYLSNYYIPTIVLYYYQRLFNHKYKQPDILDCKSFEKEIHQNQFSRQGHSCICICIL